MGLEANELKEFPKSVENLSALKEISLDDNRDLRNLPKSIGALELYKSTYILFERTHCPHCGTFGRVKKAERDIIIIDGRPEMPRVDFICTQCGYEFQHPEIFLKVL